MIIEILLWADSIASARRSIVLSRSRWMVIGRRNVFNTGTGQVPGCIPGSWIRRMFRLERFDPKWILPSRVGDNPWAWMVEVDGFVVDIRYAPRPLQEAAFRKGLIPYIPDDQEPKTPDQPDESSEKRDLPSLEAGLLASFKVFCKKAITLLREAPLDEESRQLAGERIIQLIRGTAQEMTRSHEANLTERLESAYEEVKRLVDEFSGPPSDVGSEDD